MEERWTPSTAAPGGDDVMFRDAADPRRYGAVDPEVARHIGGRGARIPAANPDGTSSGFVADVAGTVTVDPGRRHATTVDVRRLTNTQINTAMDSSRDLPELYGKLGVNVVRTAQAPPPPRENPHMPRAYLAPPGAAAEIAANPPQLRNRNPSVFPAEAEAPPPAPPYPAAGYAPPVDRPPPSPPPPPHPAYAPTQAQPAYPPAYAPPPPPPGPDPVVAATLDRMGYALERILDRLDAPPSAPLAAEPPPPLAEPSLRRRSLGPFDDSEPAQTLNDYHKAVEAPGDGAVIAGFETLRVPFLAGPVATKPRSRVFFNLGEGGRVSFFYHGVIESDGCVALIFDSRYEEGGQYVPAVNAVKSIGVEFVDGKTTRSCEVRHLGLTFRLGVLDCVVLVKTGAIEEDESGG